MFIAYKLLTIIIYPFLFLLVLLRKKINKEHPQRYKEKILSSYYNIKRNNNSRLIWFHAASIGEFKSILPIIEKLNDDHNNYDFLITTITLSSGEIAELELKRFNNVEHRFFPFDVSFLINKFLTLWRPDIIFLVDSEIWPNLILQAKNKNIPLGLINARITQKTFKRWMIFKNTAKKLFNLFDLCLTSNLETKKYLETLNAKNIYFNGNIKLICRTNLNTSLKSNDRQFSNRRIWLAASTHKGEEDFCLKVHLLIKKKYKDIITVIAPRHIDRVKNIKKDCEKLNLNTQILNKGEEIAGNKEVILVNSFGILDFFFENLKSVFIGKSILKRLEKVGGQSPIDAAKFGCKIYHGPYVYNFREIYDLFEKNKISKQIFNQNELSESLIIDLEKPNKSQSRKLDLINDLGQKTLDDTMNYINKFLIENAK